MDARKYRTPICSALLAAIVVFNVGYIITNGGKSDIVSAIPADIVKPTATKAPVHAPAIQSISLVDSAAIVLPVDGNQAFDLKRILKATNLPDETAITVDVAMPEWLSIHDGSLRVVPGKGRSATTASSSRPSPVT